ncbi:MAG: tRNA (guanosine(37)-N1)-methyltransferase TrmD [Simkaniaceae bacterium]
MDIDILTLFPEYFISPFETSILKRARQKGLVHIRGINIRDFADDKHKTVDDRPYGGGPGMVLKPQPVMKAVRSVRNTNSHVVYLSPQGRTFHAEKAKELAQKSHLVFLCGHYEGIDERALDEVDEEISIGDFVLTSGCPAALVVIDALVRFVPGVIGHEESSKQDSFEQGIFDAPHYTRPYDFEGKVVPEILKNGNHSEIAKWRLQKAWEKTCRVRPDLINCEEKRS